MAGPKKQVSKMLELLSTKIKIDKPTPVDRFHRELDPITIDGHLKVATPYIPDTELCPDGVGAPQSSKPEVKRNTTTSRPDDTQNLSAAKEGGQKPHETKHMSKSVKTQQWSKGSKLSRWTRIDKMAKAYKTTNKNGPPWHQVIRRVTINMDTKE
eukprot:2627626-Amphidinium_carterae.1